MSFDGLDILLATARFLHYAAAIQLFGATVFSAILLPQGLRASLSRPILNLERISATVLLLSGIAWLMASAASMGDGLQDAVNPSVIGTVLADTEFGHVWGPRLVICTLAIVAATFPGDRARWISVLFATLALGSLGLVGHATIDSGPLGLINETSQALHVLSSGFWLGALLPLLFLLALIRDPARASLADGALRRFSGLGHIAVAILLLSGVANTWFVIADKPNLGAPYQQLLLVKIGLAGLMCVMAIVNRYLFLPAIPRESGTRQLVRGTIIEVVLGALILALVALIGIMAPSG